MTGWRIGWIVAPPAMGRCSKISSSIRPPVSRSSCSAGQSPRSMKATASSTRTLPRRSATAIRSATRLIATNRVETLKPDGALYAFLKIDGVTDSRAAALDLVDRTGVGLAPGTAFGEGGALFMRACFLRDPLQIAEAAERCSATYSAVTGHFRRGYGQSVKSERSVRQTLNHPTENSRCVPQQRSDLEFLKRERVFSDPAYAEDRGRGNGRIGNRRSRLYRQPHGMVAARRRRSGVRARLSVDWISLGVAPEARFYFGDSVTGRCSSGSLPRTTSTRSSILRARPSYPESVANPACLL